ncbi:sensor histidine kinase [Catalinimonas niigatensis]|uniref:sensor histidine kinase n=1 Tax=Catalinimonas niigatensis TaxID=1397264 RepID=UPI0026654D31|nr:HAMP domain-containing sensor histidine kinase [Catalinimonas niigatensis]WPP50809.1 HAMP domain-containing sensor histidine kinase [Catalinimonas niigatensis]
MNKTLAKIGIVLLLIFFLPSVFFSVYQINSLNKNELIIEEIYSNQLDAILFSVNQYSADVLNVWASKVDAWMEEDTLLNSQKLAAFITEMQDLQYILVVDSADFSKVLLFNKSNGRVIDDSLAMTISETFNERKALIYRLYSYLDQGYRKIEPISLINHDHADLQVFLPQGNLPPRYICGFILSPEEFISNILGPKVQAVTQEKFIISAHRASDDALIYSSDNENNSGRKLSQLPFWLFPDYYLAIDLHGQTIEALAQNRIRNDILLIIGINVLILLGAWFVFHNIKREIELAQLKSDFVSNVSHEIRTPLALISMFAETLMMNRVQTEERKQEYYKIISQETARLTAMVNKILNFSKVEAGKRTYNLQMLDLNKVVKEVVEAYEFHVINQGFQYAFEPCKNELSIAGDQEAIIEAIVNLLDNAVKYSSLNKSISVSTGTTDHFHYVEVIDEGDGISDAHQKAIFDKFFRAAPKGKPTPRGTGLGLTLVQHIMDEHKGKIELISTVGEGSIFRLCFPIKYKLTKLLESS